MTLVVILVTWIALLGIACVTRRRFGVLGLGLAAGVVLAQNATKFVADFYQQQNLAVAPLSYAGAATVTLIVLPALILLAGGPEYRTRQAAFVGAMGFALLGTFFLLGPLTTALPTTDQSVRSALVTVGNWQNVIVIVALILALVDTYLVHGAAARHYKKSKH